MTELKTLKDFEGICRICNLELIKAEAIKWVKEIKRLSTENTYYGFEPGKEMINWIKHFFNLTDNDIQEQKNYSKKCSLIGTAPDSNSEDDLK